MLCTTLCNTKLISISKYEQKLIEECSYLTENIIMSYIKVLLKNININIFSIDEFRDLVDIKLYKKNSNKLSIKINLDYPVIIVNKSCLDYSLVYYDIKTVTIYTNKK